MMSSTYAGFIDAGFLRAEGARALGESPRNVRLDAEAIVRWYTELAYRDSGRFLRAYWYDARFDSGHDHADGPTPVLRGPGADSRYPVAVGTHRRAQTMVRGRGYATRSGGRPSRWDWTPRP